MTGWPTVRRHPRSLADAFPDVRAHCVELPAGPSRRERWLGVLLAIAIGVALTVAIVYGG